MSGKTTQSKISAAAPHTHVSRLPPGKAETGRSYARALWRIASADVSPGNSVTLYSDGDRTFDAMLQLIDSAEHSVELETYILHDDVVGERFASALSAAAERGVKVKLIADWVGMRGTPSNFLDRMRARGVDVRVFSPPGFRRWFGLIPRDHRKLLVADGKAGVVECGSGGRGLGYRHLALHFLGL